MAGGESYGGITVPEGDPGALEASAGRLVATAGMLDSISGSLRGVLGGLSWFGPASAAHTGLTGAQSTMATTASGSLIQKAAVINDYALVLEAAQRQAKKAIERAKDADRRIKEAEADIDQAITDQGTANARIIAAQAAQSRVFSSVVDFAFGDTAAAAAVDAAAAEEADARRDLEAAQERERIARRRLDEAEKDREEAQKDGDKAELAVKLARTGLIAAAQGAGLLPTQPGGPADPAFAAAAGIRLEPPKPPPKDEGNWFERRLDDVGDAASWTWDQTKQVPGGFWEGTKGIGEGAYFLYQLNPTNLTNWRDPGAMIDRYKQLGETGQYAYENPGEFGKALINYEDLENGRYGEWLGNLGPDAVVAVATGGTGAVVTREHAGDEGDGQAHRRRARLRPRDRHPEPSMPTQRYRDEKTVAAQRRRRRRRSRSAASLHGAGAGARAGWASTPICSRATPARDVASGMKSTPATTCRPPVGPHAAPTGYYYGTHAELRLLIDEPKVPVGVTRHPCTQNCDPGIQRSPRAQGGHRGPLARGPDAVPRRRRGRSRPSRPSDFTGVNSRGRGAVGRRRAAPPRPARRRAVRERRRSRDEDALAALGGGARRLARAAGAPPPARGVWAVDAAVRAGRAGRRAAAARGAARGRRPARAAGLGAGVPGRPPPARRSSTRSCATLRSGGRRTSVIGRGRAAANDVEQLAVEPGRAARRSTPAWQRCISAAEAWRRRPRSRPLPAGHARTTTSTSRSSRRWPRGRWPSDDPDGTPRVLALVRHRGVPGGVRCRRVKLFRGTPTNGLEFEIAVPGGDQRATATSRARTSCSPSASSATRPRR